MLSLLNGWIQGSWQNSWLGFLKGRGTKTDSRGTSFQLINYRCISLPDTFWNFLHELIDRTRTENINRSIPFRAFEFLLWLFKLWGVFHVLNYIFHFFLLLGTGRFLLFYNYLMKDSKLPKKQKKNQFSLRKTVGVSCCYTAWTSQLFKGFCAAERASAQISFFFSSFGDIGRNI